MFQNDRRAEGSIVEWNVGVDERFKGVGNLVVLRINRSVQKINIF